MNVVTFSPEELAKLGVRFPVVTAVKHEAPTMVQDFTVLNLRRMLRRNHPQVMGIYGQQNLSILMVL